MAVETDIRVKARTAAKNARRRGRLKRQPCENCGATENIEGHHDDYSRPLDVRWLCRDCHRDLHAGLNANAENTSEVRKDLLAVSRAAQALTAREKAVDQARELLRQKIKEAAKAGASQSAIARASGLSRQYVARLLAE